MYGQGLKFKEGKSKEAKETSEATSSSKTNSKSKSHELPKPCYCLAIKHDYVTNCTHCGYILCQIDKDNQTIVINSDNEETYTCPKCQKLCMKPLSYEEAKEKGYDESTLRSYKQKDTLLLYDREHAKRTVVRDAQGDYYVGSAWLNEEEKEKILQKEKSRIEKKKNAKQKLLNVYFDYENNRGKQGKVVEVINRGEYESEEEDDEEETDEGFQICKPGLDERDDVDPTLSVYENDDLMLQGSKAAEVYRFLREK